MCRKLISMDLVIRSPNKEVHLIANSTSSNQQKINQQKLSKLIGDKIQRI